MGDVKLVASALVAMAFAAVALAWGWGRLQEGGGVLFAETPEDTFTARAVPALTDSGLPERETLEEDSGRAATRAPEPTLLATRAAFEAAGLEVTLGEGRRMVLPLESLFALPGERLVIEAAAPDSGAFVPQDVSGGLRPLGPGRWTWTAPEQPGVYPFRLVHQPSGAQIQVNAFVLVPADSVREEKLRGYRIGRYPATALRGDSIYEPPPGFVEVTEENCETHVTPRLRLCQFPAKQGDAYPKYVVLRPELLLKLELVLDALVDRGLPVTSFHVMSGYRTPYYNVSVLGNVPYSRHQWGGAADVFVDENPQDGTMDDLNGDGRVDLADARFLHAVVDSLERARPDLVPIGGLGVYRATAAHGPFVHIDARGTPARW